MSTAIAFKEWSTICQALATGKQSIILRKGGIAEKDGRFLPEYDSFWLFPTYFHQNPEDLNEEGQKILLSENSSPQQHDFVSLNALVKVSHVYDLRNLDLALSTSPFHCFSESTIWKRFSYRAPGIFVLAVRVYKIPEPLRISNLPDYAGCKTWVPLQNFPGDDIETLIEKQIAQPVLSDREYHDFLEQIDRLLNPIAYV